MMQHYARFDDLRLCQPGQVRILRIPGGELNPCLIMSLQETQDGSCTTLVVLVLRTTKMVVVMALGFWNGNYYPRERLV